MKLRFQSRHGLSFVAIPQLLGHELGNWSNGQERDVPDDLKLPVKMRIPDGPIGLALATDALLKSGPDMVDAGTGVNPDFACHVCGKETLSEYYRGIDGEIVPYEDADGNRLCIRHYLLAQPEGAYAWQHHLRVERGDERHAATLAEKQGRNLDDDGDAVAASVVAVAAAPSASIEPLAALPEDHA